MSVNPKPIRIAACLSVAWAACLITATSKLPAQAVHAKAKTAEVDDDGETRAIHNYRLSMEELEAAAAATDTINQTMRADPDLEKRMKAFSYPEKSVANETRQLDNDFPQVTAIIHQHGLATREYLLIKLAVVIDVYFVAMKRQGEDKDYPPDAILPANAVLIEKNFDKVVQLGQRIYFDYEPR